MIQNIKNYYVLCIKINPQMEDDVSNICFENLNCLGVLLEEEKYIDMMPVETTRGTLKVYLKDLAVPANTTMNVCEFIKMKREELKECGFTDNELGSWDCELIERPAEDWSRKWKEKWGITRITDKIIIVPSWIKYKPEPQEIAISIDPGNAFGTGTHQTTQIPVRCLEKYLKPNDKVADIGTGSGILGIVAKKLGADYVYGCDIDSSAIKTAQENAAKNNVDCVFELNTADKINEKFDFICANILHNVLAGIAGDLKSIMKPGAMMILSGIADNKKEIVLAAIQKENLLIKETLKQDQWVGYLVTRT